MRLGPSHQILCLGSQTDVKDQISSSNYQCFTTSTRFPDPLTTHPTYGILKLSDPFRIETRSHNFEILGI